VLARFQWSLQKTNSAVYTHKGLAKSATEGDFTRKLRGFVNYPLVKNEPQKLNNRSSQIASPPQTVNKPEARSHELAGTNTTSGVAPEPNPETKTDVV